ncbi:sec1 family hypothetical protein [Limosa lapponica baueri]|uniref:Sec1 family domain-containing protein 2 n=1 Tax=Limosa lapponica baueri TaxID=1758121 RepID=A0A2I0U0E0_LIMLA|nr:sec1 family hypothetical protein [Limosa lapponica baueri]
MVAAGGASPRDKRATASASAALALGSGTLPAGGHRECSGVYASARNRRRTATNKASVVFVDRTLDLAGAVGHHGDNLAEKILSVLPKLPGHKTDVMVNMVELTALQTADETCSIIAPGCLAQPNDPAAKALWESFMNLKQKEAVMEARRHLVEAASRENLPIKMSMGRVTPEQLSSYVQLFRNNLKALENHCGLLQLVLATVQTLKHPQTSKWDNFLAFERLLLQVALDYTRCLPPIILRRRQLFMKDLLGVILLDSDSVGIIEFLLMDACQTSADAKGDNPV